MSRRRSPGEVNVGSDSFLDVIANIVGILIILIVLTGLRVIHAPVRSQTVTSSPEPVSVETPVAAAVPEPLPPMPVVEAMPEPDLPEPVLEPIVEVTEPPTELTARIERLRADLAAAESTLTQLQQSVQVAQTQQTDLESRQATQQTELRTGQGSYQAVKRSRAELEQLVETQHAVLQDIRATLAESERKTPPAKTLQHRLTPVSQVTVREQIHFRLLNQKVSYVPIQELVEQAAYELRRHGDSVLKSKSRIGQVGPVKGYHLHYKLEVMGPSGVELARQGGGVMRIGMTSFELHPTVDVVEESTEAALSAGSRFLEAVQTARPGTTFTLWVYPDSFQMYRELQTALQEQGFLVAGRPLPRGIPIAGSPDGSASAGQ